MQRILLICLVILLAPGVLLGASQPEPLRFTIIQPGQPGSPEEAQPIIDSLAAFLESQLGPGTIVTGRYFNSIDPAVKFLKKTPPRWAIVSLGFFVENATRFNLVALASTRPMGWNSDRWHMVAKRGTENNWRAIRGKVHGTMLFNNHAAACLFFGNSVTALPFTLAGTSRPLRFLREAARGPGAAVILDRVQYETLKSLPLVDNIETIHRSPELPTSPVVWFGNPDEQAKRLASVLLQMKNTPDSKGLLQLLRTDGFGPPDLTLEHLKLSSGDETCPP